MTLKTRIAALFLRIIRWSATFSSLGRVCRFSDLELVDLLSHNADELTELRSLVGGALEDLESSGFRDTMAAGIRTVVAFGAEERAAPALCAYSCPFGEELRSRRGLACRLLWFAVHNVAHNAAANGEVALIPTAIAKACHETQLAFVKHFPDGDVWTALLENAYSQHRPAPDPA